MSHKYHAVKFVAVVIGAYGISGGSLRANPCISASTLDAHLQKHNSPLAGLGTVFIEAGSSYRVDPRLLVAIAGQETGYATKELKARYNAFNWFYAGASVPAQSDFENFDQAITETARGVRDKFWDQLGKTTIQRMAEGSDGYTATQKSEWIANVTAIYRGLGIDGSGNGGGDINDLSYSCADSRVLFFDDAEVLRGNNWPGQGLWSKTTNPYATPWFSLNHAWQSGVSTNANYSLISTQIDLRNVSSASLTFWHKYSFQGNVGATVWVKPSGGSYVSLGSFNGLGPASWTRVNKSLSSFIGQTVELWFQLYSTSPASGSGWYVDNVLVSVAQAGGSIDFDSQAKRDLITRASRDGRFGAPVPETFGKDPYWTQDWELRWMAFNVVGNRYAFVYDARNKHSGDRFTTFFDPDTNKQVDWVFMP